MSTETKGKTGAIEIIERARRVSTPIVAVETPDVAGFAETLVARVNGRDPIVGWDGVRGLVPANESGVEAIAKAASKIGADPETLALQSANPVEGLKIAAELPPRTMILHSNAHLYFGDPFFLQAIANVRDLFKGDGRTLVLLGPSFELPAELRSDVVVLDDPFPSDEALAAIVNEIASAAGFEIDDAVRVEAVNATRGLSAFGAEQVLALSATPTGFDVADLWTRKIAAVNQTKGLTLSIERSTMEVGGLEALLKFADGLFAGKRAPNAVVWIDEIEKMFGGLGTGASGGDSSGVTQDALGAVLRYMDGGAGRARCSGLLFVGPPGTGKSLVSNAIAKRHGVPLFAVDLGATKGSLVGESERAIRSMFRTIDGVAAGAALVVATCNKLEILPAELRRRFSLGTWYCDLPTAEERAVIWSIHKRAHGIDDDEATVEDNDWTGAEIRNCCDIAERLGVPLAEAARFVVPVSTADPKSIENLRRSATGAWISATTGGAYQATLAAKPAAKRSFQKS